MLPRNIILILITTILTLAFDNTAVAYHNPSSGRFLQRDPAGYVDSQNLYEYVRSKPIRMNDPSGETALTCENTGQAWFYTGWKVFAMTPGDLVGGNHIGNVRRYKWWLARPFRQLFKCCDENNIATGKWGLLAYEVGTHDDGTETALAADLKLQIRLPLPFGKAVTADRLNISLAWSQTADIALGKKPKNPSNPTFFVPSDINAILPPGYDLVENICCSKQGNPWPPAGGIDAIPIQGSDFDPKIFVPQPKL